MNFELFANLKYFKPVKTTDWMQHSLYRNLIEVNLIVNVGTFMNASASVHCNVWSAGELEGLVQFVLENGKSDVWATPRTTQQSVHVCV